MATLYADEDFSYPVIQRLRQLGHDILTADWNLNRLEVGGIMPPNTDLYEQDFYAWTQQQAALLREGKMHELDLANLAEEIESVGRSDKRELGNRLEVIVMHLLKWRYQPEGRQESHSWEDTI